MVQWLSADMRFDGCQHSGQFIHQLNCPFCGCRNRVGCNQKVTKYEELLYSYIIQLETHSIMNTSALNFFSKQTAKFSRQPERLSCACVFFFSSAFPPTITQLYIPISVTLSSLPSEQDNSFWKYVQEIWVSYLQLTAYRYSTKYFTVWQVLVCLTRAEWQN